MARRLAVLIAVVTVVAAVPAAAEARSLSIREAKALAARQAEKVERDLRSEGAQRSKVPGCWRNTARKVSCFFSVYGYDRELDYKWQCMLRVVVRLRDRPSPEHGRYRFKYGTPRCG